MRAGLFLLMGLFWLSEVGAQALTKRIYTQEDGLKHLETKGMFIMPDSQIVVIQMDGLCSYFDGYNFYPTQDNLGLSKGYVLQSAQDREISIVNLSKNEIGSESYVSNKNNFKKLGSKKDSISIFYSRDTLFFRKKDTIKYYNSKKEALKYSHIFPPQFSQKLLKNKKAFYSESLEGKDLIFFDNDFYRKNKRGEYDKIVAEELIPDRTEIDENLRSLNVDPSRISNHNLAFNFNFYSFNNCRNLINISVTSDEKDNVKAILIDKNSNKVINIIYKDQAQFRAVATNDFSYLTAWHTGLQRTQNYIRYFDPRLGDTPEALHTIVETSEGKILMGGYGSGFSIWDGKTIQKIPDINNWSLILPGAFSYKEDQVLFFSDDSGTSINVLQDENIKEIKPTVSSLKRQRDKQLRPYYFAGYFIDTLKNGKLAFGLAHRGFGIMEEWKEDSLEVKLISDAQGMKLINVLHFQQDKEERIWMGRTSKGISIYNPILDTAYTWLRNADIPNSYGSICGHTDEWGNIWLGSNQGLKFIENPTRIKSDRDPLFDLTRHIELPNGDRSAITSMTQVDSFLVIGNSTAISFLNLEAFYRNPKYPLIYQLLFGEDIEGGGAEQNAVLFDSKRQLWFGCQEGVLQLDWDNFAFDKTTTTILLRNIKAGSDTLLVDNENSITLPTDNRNCRIKFGPRRNNSLMKNIFFDYFMITPQGDTLTSVLYNQNGVFSYNNFTPGNYRLEIIAKKHGQIIDKKNINIKVPMTLSENPWFWAGLAFVFGSALFSFFIYRNRKRHQLLEKELLLNRLHYEKNNLQIQTIISSFNPHFINNSLHWIQSRYNKDESMVKLIGRLSENIAVIFGNTQKGRAYHTIEKELLIVRNYIAIQKIRFRESFSYQEILPENKDILQQNILLMHLQIHVENAVEHGLRNREAGKFLRLKIEETNNAVLLTIEDEGCGREYARQIGSKGTQTGTKMVQGLMKIFNENNKEKIEQKYEDNIFTDQNGKYGTRVLIIYPKNLNYDL